MKQYHKKTLAHICQTLTPHDSKIFKENIQTVDILSGSEIMPFNDDARSVYFVLEGQLRVYRISKEGKEITLYRMNEGEACILSMSFTLLPAIASSFVKAEVDTTLIKLPQSIYELLISRNPEFRELIFKRIFTVLNQVMSLSEEIAFHSITRRIASKIIELMEIRQTKVLSTTHEEIAFELGTAREVVSRTLKYLTTDGIIKKTRGRLEILNEKILRELAEN